MLCVNQFQRWKLLNSPSPPRLSEHLVFKKSNEMSNNIVTALLGLVKDHHYQYHQNRAAHYCHYHHHHQKYQADCAKAKYAFVFNS